LKRVRVDNIGPKQEIFEKRVKKMQ
jgi:hypothetical protein